MPATETAADAAAQHAETLQALGYKQELHRGITVLGNVALALSDITPTAAVLTTLAVILTTAGTASRISIAIAFFIAISVALCMGELGSMHPLASGLYSIVNRVFGKPIGFLALVDYVGQGGPLPPIIVIVGVVIALSQQQPRDLLISAGVFLVAAAYYFAFLRPRKDRYWLPEGACRHAAVSRSPTSGCDRGNVAAGLVEGARLASPSSAPTARVGRTVIAYVTSARIAA